MEGSERRCLLLQIAFLIYAEVRVWRINALFRTLRLFIYSPSSITSKSVSKCSKHSSLCQIAFSYCASRTFGCWFSPAFHLWIVRSWRLFRPQSRLKPWSHLFDKQSYQPFHAHAKFIARMKLHSKTCRYLSSGAWVVKHWRLTQKSSNRRFYVGSWKH